MTATTKPKAIKPAGCPVCGAPTDRRFRPFCSRRCADVDLGRWLTGSYAIPAEEEDAPDADMMRSTPPGGETPP